jgi:hypothetical protein
MALLLLIVGAALILATLHRATLERVLAFMRSIEHVPFWNRLEDNTQDRAMRWLAFACGVVLAGAGLLAVVGAINLTQ